MRIPPLGRTSSSPLAWHAYRASSSSARLTAQDAPYGHPAGEGDAATHEAVFTWVLERRLSRTFVTRSALAEGI